MTELDTATLQDEVLTRSEKWPRSPYGLLGLGLVSFLESALPVPIVTDPFLVVYILANRAQAMAAVVITTVTSVLGGLVAYVLAFWFGSFLLSFLGPNSLQEFYGLADRVGQETFLLTILATLTPVPYTIVAVAVGVVKGNVIAFILGSLIGQGLRYALVGYITYRYGPRIIEEFRRHTLLISIITICSVGIYSGSFFSCFPVSYV